MELEELKQRAEQGEEGAFRKLDAWHHRIINYPPGQQVNFSEKGIAQWYLDLEKWYFELANRGNVHAQFHIGKIFERDGNYHEAMNWYLKSAEQGFWLSQEALADVFQSGEHGVEQDYSKAMQWYLRAAAQGSMMACIKIGRLYEYGYGVEKDYSEAIIWYKKAAKSDYASALMRLLRLLHKCGKYEEALEWLAEATKENPDLCKWVGAYYEQGKGIEKNIDEAMRWYKKGAQNGNLSSKIFYGKKLFEQKEYADALAWFEKAIGDKEISDNAKEEVQDYIEKCQKSLNASNNSTLVVKGEGVEKITSKEPISNDFDMLLQQLQSLIGLNEVKQEVSTLVNLLKLQSMRKQHGLPEIPLSRHLVFVGNPGTGKTTVARLLSEIYHQLGILSKGQLIEVDRSGLVAGYVGQTALKTQEVIQSALGGILFIDEAYTLAKSDSSNDFGQEAIDTILKAMEDHREDFVVIVAGYPDLMRAFINSNPGLKSRFNKYIYFQDYNPKELLDIFKLQCKKAGLILEDGASEIAFDYLQKTYEHRDSNFANGRSVRNYFERVLSNQANRLAMQVAVSETDLVTLSKDDVMNAAADTTM